MSNIKLIKRRAKFRKPLNLESMAYSPELEPLRNPPGLEAFIHHIDHEKGEIIYEFVNEIEFKESILYKEHYARNNE